MKAWAYGSQWSAFIIRNNTVGSGPDWATEQLQSRLAGAPDPDYALVGSSPGSYSRWCQSRSWITSHNANQGTYNTVPTIALQLLACLRSFHASTSCQQNSSLNKQWEKYKEAFGAILPNLRCLAWQLRLLGDFLGSQDFALDAVATAMKVASTQNRDKGLARTGCKDGSPGILASPFQMGTRLSSSF